MLWVPGKLADAKAKQFLEKGKDKRGRRLVRKIEAVRSRPSRDDLFGDQTARAKAPPLPDPLLHSVEERESEVTGSRCRVGISPVGYA
jgi:hypothetical protein